MAARGIKVNYDNQNYCVHVTGLSLPMSANDIVATGWMRIKGNNSSDRGQMPFTLYDGTNNTEVSFIDQTFDGASPWSLTSYDVNGTTDTVGSWAPLTDEDWYYAMVWSAVSTRWRYYAAKNGAANLGTIANGATARTPRTFDTLIIGNNAFGSYGNNTEHTCQKLWSGSGISTSFLALSGQWLLDEMKSDAVVHTGNLVLHLPLLSSSLLSDDSGNGNNGSIVGTVTDGTMNPSDIAAAAYKGARAIIIG